MRVFTIAQNTFREAVRDKVLYVLLFFAAVAILGSKALGWISIGQDIKHRIMESGLARKLIGERSPTLRADVMTEIELLVENDERLVPGTIVIREEAPERVLVTARTYEFGDLEVTL